MTGEGAVQIWTSSIMVKRRDAGREYVAQRRTLRTETYIKLDAEIRDHQIGQLPQVSLPAISNVQPHWERLGVQSAVHLNRNPLESIELKP